MGTGYIGVKVPVTTNQRKRSLLPPKLFPIEINRFRSHDWREEPYALKLARAEAGEGLVLAVAASRDAIASVGFAAAASQRWAVASALLSGGGEPILRGTKLQMSWMPSLLTQKRRNGPPLGLRNLCNTCYLNSVLQCLTYTPPFANYCLSHTHSSLCKSLSFLEALR